MDLPPPSQPASSPRVTLGALVELTKYRLSSLVGVTTAAGALLARPEGPVDGRLVAWTLVGTLLAAFGANALNQCLERTLDRRMERTRSRPLPSGRLSLRLGVVWGAGLVATGGAVLGVWAGGLPAALALAVALIYVGLYTPLKQRSSLNTLVGAVCGAIPPMIGWAAVAGRLEPGAWILFGVLFLWQVPHFMAIDWFHRNDYARGGFRMASAVDPSGEFSGHQAVVYSLALIPVSALAPLGGMGGWLSVAGAVALGVGLFGLSISLWVARSRAAARALFLGTLVYLPAFLGLLLLDPTR